MEIKGRKAIEENLYRALTQQGQHEDAERPVYNRKLLLEYDEFIDLISRYGNYFLKLRGEGKNLKSIAATDMLLTSYGATLRTIHHSLAATNSE